MSKEEEQDRRLTRVENMLWGADGDPGKGIVGQLVDMKSSIRTGATVISMFLALNLFAEGFLVLKETTGF